jgi:mannosyl-glycoprotein endo-beta-N-acetylglucosaminidase
MRRAIPRALCVVVLFLAALPTRTHARHAPAAAFGASVPAPNACGSYQCFYRADDFLRSVPSPKPAQVATVPLHGRAVSAAPNAPEMLVGLDNGPWVFWPVSDGFAQGRSGVIDGVPAGNVFNFSHWQYVDELYYYVHQTVAIPPTQWVNAAHRNGVAVLGTVTPDCNVCGPEAAKLFTPGTYKQTVRKLHDYAVAYGFDGWLIDIEATDLVPSRTLLQAVTDLTRATLLDGRNLRVVLYHGNEFSLGPLLPYFEAGAQWQSDYDSATIWPPKTYRTLVERDLQAQKQRAFWASYVYAYQGKCAAGEQTTRSQIWNGNRTSGTTPQCLDTAALFANQRAIVPPRPQPGAPRFYTSASLFAPIWPFVGNLPDKAAPASRDLVHAADDALWVGSGVQYSGSPCRRSGTDNAVSALITPRSVVGDLPFVTSFNAGEGDTYAIQGTEIRAAPWNNLSVQDVLPTWFCVVRGGLNVAIGYAAGRSGDAYNGGSALRLSGSAGEVELYQARIAVGVRARPMLAFVTKTDRGASPYVRISYSDGTSELVPATTSGRSWRQTVSPLEGRGRTITAISVGVRGSQDRVDALLGQIRLYDGTADAVPAPIPVSSTAPVITWSVAAKPPAVSWNVYRSTPDCLRFLGPAVTNSYDVTQAMFGPGSGANRYVIQPVSAAGSAPDVGPLCPVPR